MTSEVETIARGLSPSEQEAVLYPGVEGQFGVSAAGAYFNPPYKQWRKIPELIEVGRFGKQGGYRCRLTPIGRDVRAFLQAADQGKE